MVKPLTLYLKQLRTHFRRLPLAVFVGAGVLLCAGQAPAAPKTPKASVAPKAAKLPVLLTVVNRADLLRSVLEMTNRERMAKGLAPLILDPLLTQAAQAHADDMRAKNYFSHTDLHGGQPWDRTRATGYISDLVGENIAWGQHSPREVMTAWMGSEGHRENILDTGYRAIGVGVAGDYWVQVFGDVMTRISGVPAVPSLPLTPDGDTILADFESGSFDGWELSGNCWGSGPEGLAFAGTTLSGWAGRGFASTAHRRAPGFDTPSGTGRALSAPFVIPADATAIRFRIAGGRYPGRCCLNLVVEDAVVRTATGESAYRLEQAQWDIADLRGKSARLEIRDDVATGTNAFVHVDEIVLVRGPAQATPKKENARPAPKRQNSSSVR